MPRKTNPQLLLSLAESDAGAYCFTVSELTERLQTLITEDDILGNPLVVQGEVSNVKISSRGHLYFTLKDEEATIKAKMWASQVKLLPFDLEDGMAVYLTGHLEIYAPHGEYSLTARKLEPVGVGSLQLAFQQIKEKLEAEGLFLDEFKKPLPEFPMRLGIITSSTGSVIHDMLRVIRNKNPLVHVLLHPVKVQGEGAAQEISAAIQELNHDRHALDVLLIARGGGSFEDLFCFSDESVVRAIFASRVPVITGIGHEPDFSLADAVADHSASTPTAAAEAAVPDIELLQQTVTYYHATLIDSFTQQWEQAEQRFDYATTAFLETMQHLLKNADQNIRRLSGEMEALSPLNTLSRGYVLATQEGVPVMSIDQLQLKTLIQLQFHDGKATCEVQTLDQTTP